MSSQYSGGCQVQWRVPSTVEGYHEVLWGAIMKYSGGCSVQWRAIISTVEGYPKYSGGLSYFMWGAIMQYSGGCKYSGGLSCSTVEVVNSTVE